MGVTGKKAAAFAAALAVMLDWKAGDLCEDDRLDVFDIVLMRRELIER